jgi:osmotically-inducible protein OsmY
MRTRFFTTLAAIVIAVGCNEKQNTPTAKYNTNINQRDRSGDIKTPIDQNENKADIDLTANIRKRVVDRKMSVNAQNVKIITQDGKVTLRGPVKSDDEKKQIEQIANDVAGAGNVDSQLEIQP